MAVTVNGILNFQIESENINSSIFYNFIKNTIDTLTEKEHIFLFDNVRFHHNKEMLKLIISCGHKYIFTPSLRLGILNKWNIFIFKVIS